MSDDAFDHAWITGFAAAFDVPPLDDAAVEQLLAIAAHAAHDSGDRRNAPLACFLAGLRLGRDGTAPDPASLAPFTG